jgi:hypothetical protein
MMPSLMVILLWCAGALLSELQAAPDELTRRAANVETLLEAAADGTLSEYARALVALQACADALEREGADRRTPEFDTKRPFRVFSDRRLYWNQQLSCVALIFL